MSGNPAQQGQQLPGPGCGRQLQGWHGRTGMSGQPLGLVLPGKAGKWRGTSPSIRWGWLQGQGASPGKLHPRHQLSTPSGPRVRALAFLSALYLSGSPVEPLSPAPGPGAGLLPARPLGLPSGTPRVPSPPQSSSSPSISHPAGCPGLALRVPLTPAPSAPAPAARRDAAPGAGPWPHGCSNASGAEEVRAGTSPGGAVPSRPGPPRLASPRCPGAPRLPPVPGVAPILLTLCFISRIIHTSRRFHLSLPGVGIPKGFVVRSFFPPQSISGCPSPPPCPPKYPERKSVEVKFMDYSVSVRCPVLSPASPQSPGSLGIAPPSAAFH